MPNVGYATIQIIPSVRGISDELRRQLVGPAGDAGGDAGEAAGSGLRDKMAAGAAVAGAAAGALLVAGITEAMDQASITSTLQAQLGATGQEAARYGKIAGKLYSSGITTDIQQGADTIRAIVNAGLTPPDATNKQLTSIATKMADVANTFGTDMSMQTQAVSALMKNGLAPSASAALDVITVGMQKLGPNAEDLLDTFQEYPVQLKKLGIDSKMALGLFQQGLQGGARDTDIIADSFKEFSIRAIDMSETSQDAYKALGLSAEDMSLKIAKGGKGANDGLQLVLDRLRGIKDPVKQNAAAVGLFGTQAEDLGTALFKLDPGKAAGGFGKVSGAAAGLGKVLRSGPSHEIEVFVRTLKQGFVDFLGGEVLPVVSRVAHGLNTYLVPPLRIVGSAIASVLLPALVSLWQGGVAVVDWLRDMGTWLIPVGIAVVGFTAAIFAQQIATAAVTAVFAIYRGAILAWTAVQKGATIAQAAFNLVMNANPVILVITAILALGAALYVAYQRSETFRNIVQGAWQGIQTAASFAWNSILKPAFAGFMTGLRAIGDAAIWLWTTAIKPAFAFISTAARILATLFVIVVGGPIYLAVRAIGAVVMWLWDVAIKPSLEAIGALAMWLWTSVIKPAASGMMTGFQAVGTAAVWLWKNAIRPAFFGIREVLVWIADHTVKPVITAIRAAFSAMGSAGKSLWQNAIKPAFNGIASVISTVWNSGIKPTFNALKSAIGLVGKAFGAAKDAIKLAWDKVKGIAKAPVQFIVDTVYNKGIVGVWNKVAGAFGAPKLGKFSFARGGVLPGYTPGRDPHKFYSPTGGALEMSGGEAIMRPEFTRAVGSGFVGHMNKIARTRGAGGVKAALAPTFGGNPNTPTQRFADGGIFGWIGKGVAGAGSAAWDGIKKSASWLKDGLEASARAGVKHVVDPLLKSFPGMDTGFGQMVRKIPSKILDALFGYSKEADKKGAGGIGGPRVQKALSWARTQAGKRYQWGGNGNPSWDCSGFVSAIESVLRGQKPHRRWATMAFSGATAPPGWKQNANSPFRIGITNAGVGHTAGTLGGVNVESRGGDGVVVGKKARGYSNGLFNSRYGFTPATKYDSGGWVQPGLTSVANATGRPEALLTSSQWRVAQSAMAGGGGPVTVEVHTRDEALAEFIDIRVYDRDRKLIQTLDARGGG
ncbi:replication protein [Streptomyces niveus]|uniref:phage tail tape measure protein n=1 Tax=Streptomyces niveus TaxID=193462 RepID=UPI00386BCFC7|nr:replication protein [Streptomyces niveus]